MIRGQYNQARCDFCGSWHFAIQMDDSLNPIEYKCCRCGRLTAVKHYIKKAIEKKEA